MFEVLHMVCAAVRVGFIMGSLYPSIAASAVVAGFKARVKKIPAKEVYEELHERMNEKLDNAKRKVEVIMREL